MSRNKLHCNHHTKVVTATKENEILDGYIATLHPAGSFDGTKKHTKPRELVKPEINYLKAVCNLAVPLLLFAAICLYKTSIAVLVLGIYTLIRLHEILIWCIRNYQKWAPDNIRISCVFEPSCSEYMILSLYRYGVIRGTMKGIKRLLRCNSPNGGEDYP